MTGERVPPHSEEAERAVLGSLLLEDQRVMDLCQDYRLSVEAFYVPTHKSVYAAMLDLTKHATPIDTLTVGDALKNDGKLDTIGGSAILDSLIDTTPTSAHAEFYIDVVARKARLRGVISQSRETEARCFEEDDELTVEEIIASNAAGMTRIDQLHKVKEVSWSDTVKESMKQTEAAVNSGKSLVGLSTGFMNLDNGTLGLKPGEMTVLAARPSMGKTSLAMNIVEHIASGHRDPDAEHRPVGVFSLEMSAIALALRMKCSYAQVNYWDFLRRMQKSIPVHADVTKLVHAAGILSKLPILCDDTGGLDIQQLRLRARRWRDKKQVEIIVVDYLQLLHDRENSRQGRQVEVSKISASLKECAKELNIPILALAQLSRQPEQKGRGGIPKLSDLRDSGSIEQDADNVWLMRRPCKCEDDPQAEDKTLAIIDVAKQRNGPTGPVHLNFQPEFTRFEDRATGLDGQEDFEEFDAL